MPPKSAPPPVLYPRVAFAVYADPAKSGVTPELAALIRAKLAEIGCADLLSYNPPMTYTDAVTYLGAEWESEGGDYGESYLFLDREGRKVRCTHNVRNRPIHASTYEARVQDVLGHRWELNGETGVIGRSGTVLDFQHTCVALILAWQDWVRVTDPATGLRKYLSQWPVEKYPDGPTIEKCVVYGIEESDTVVNTINTGRPRSLADVFYRCPYFATLPAKSADHCDRVTAAKVAADAIRVVWHRTGMYRASHGSTMTHSEACAWVENHGGVRSRLLEATRHVLECNRDGSITAHVRLGYAVAMCFLMGQWDTDDARVGKYYADEVRSGKRLSWTGWERAKEFWAQFGDRKKPTDAQAEKGLPGDPTGPLQHLTAVLDHESAIEARPDYDGGPRGKQRDYAIVSGWRAYRGKGATVRHAACEVKYTRADRYGVKSLDWAPDERTVGGIDLGNERIAPDPSDDAAPAPVPVTSTPVTPTQKFVSDAVRDAELRDQPDDPGTPILTAAGDGVTDLLALIRDDHPDFDVILLRTPTGGYAAWGNTEVAKVAPYHTKTVRLHPKGINHISFRADEVEVLSDHLTTAGLSLGLCVENVSAGKGEPRYAVEVVHRGGKDGG